MKKQKKEWPRKEEKLHMMKGDYKPLTKRQEREWPVKAGKHHTKTTRLKINNKTNSTQKQPLFFWYCKSKKVVQTPNIKL